MATTLFKVFIGEKNHSFAEQSDLLTQIIDGDTLILLDSVANELKCSPWFHVPYALNLSYIKVQRSGCALPLWAVCLVLKIEWQEVNRSSLETFENYSQLGVVLYLNSRHSLIQNCATLVCL